MSNSIAVNDSTTQSKLIDKSMLHTAEASIQWRDGLNLIPCRNSKKAPELITNWRTVDNGRTAKFKINANHVCNCNSLTDFERILNHWARTENFKPSDVHLHRVDYAFDSTNEKTVDMFVKAASLVYFAFVAKHKPRETDRKRFEIADTFCCTGYLGRRKGYAIQINLYDKKVQKPSSDTLWRCEFRYIETANNKCDDAKAMLEAIIAELESLKGYYNQALERLSINLAQHFNSLQQGTQKQLSKNQHLFTYNDRVFSRQQIKEFFKIVLPDDNEQTWTRRTNDFADAYPHLFVGENEYNAFIDEMISHMKRYIGYPFKWVSPALCSSPVDSAWIAQLLGDFDA